MFRHLRRCHKEVELSSEQTSEPASQTDFTDALLMMIVRDYEPLNVVEKKGFKDLMRICCPQFSLPTRETLTSILLPKIYKEYAVKLKKKLQQTGLKIALTADCWSSIAVKSYLTTSIHFIDDWKLYSLVLDVSEFKGSHTSTRIQQRLVGLLNHWEISKNMVSTYTTDNASDITAAVTLLSSIHVPCFAHTLHLSIRPVLFEIEELNGIITQVKIIVQHYHHSPLASDALKAIQQYHYGKSISLIQEVKTRWNSLYSMLLSIERIKDAVITDLVERDLASSLPSERSWLIINQLILLLKHFNFVSDTVCGETYVTISMVIPAINTLQKHLQNPVTLEELDLITKTRQLVLEDLNMRLRNQPQVLYLAAFLDPRFKSLDWTTSDGKTLLLNKLKAEVNKIKLTGLVPKIKKECELFWGINAHAEEDDASVEIECYLQDQKEASRTSNPLMWWKAHEDSYPRLAVLAKVYLAIQATSAKSERTFSACGTIMTPERSRLEPDVLNQLIFLNKNMDFLT